jgi:toxin-antitoxin system PIN domain toxin
VWDGHKHHPAALDWFNGLEQDEICFCRVTQMGFLRLLTNPNMMGDDVRSNNEAWGAFDQLCADPRIDFSDEMESLETAWRSCSASASPGTNVWTDSYLAAFAIAHHLHVVTFDTGFERYPQLTKTVLRVSNLE